uniref:DM2 domain-containing protein n=1 Tax=Kalanchoe fedtschenkoi TaxID=63787 RepID=A0A7N0VL23_KALFE
MATDHEIAQALETLLRDPNPNLFTSLNAVVQQLESRLGRDLSDKFEFIRTQIHQALLRSQHRPHQPHPPPQQPQPQHQPVFMQPQPNYRDHFPFRPMQAFHSGPSSYVPQYLSFGSPAPPTPKSESFPPPPEASKPSAQPKPKRKGGAGGLNKPCGVTPELQAIVGHAALPRTEIVKQLWAYIRKNNLQDPNNKRKIICNDELRLVFETDCTDMFKMNKLLAKHIISLEPAKQPSAKKSKVVADPDTRKTESSPGRYVIISEGLADLFGTDVKKMLQSEVEARVHDYIKASNLEDPKNSSVIQCDSKLQELFQCETLPATGITELMVLHNLFSRG